MNTPWLKSLIFWSVVVSIIFVVFQCTMRSESSKAAPTLMYERLYYCTQELNAEKDDDLIRKIKMSIRPDLRQVELMQLINECRQRNPMKSTESYMNAIKNLEYEVEYEPQQAHQHDE